MRSSYLTVEEVAGRFRVTPAAIRLWRHSGYGPKSVKIGRRILYSESDVVAFEDTLRHDGQHARP